MFFFFSYLFFFLLPSCVRISHIPYLLQGCRAPVSRVHTQNRERSMYTTTQSGTHQHRIRCATTSSCYVLFFSSCVVCTHTPSASPAEHTQRVCSIHRYHAQQRIPCTHNTAAAYAQQEMWWNNSTSTHNGIGVLYCSSILC